MPEQLLTIAPSERYDKVEAAYDGLNEVDKATFRRAILAPVDVHGHEEIARALRALGYDIDRKQVHLFREKLARGKVRL